MGLWWIVWILALIATHEYGHAWLAKRQGIYVGWGIFPTPHVKLKGRFKSRWGYLSGLFGSLFSFPMFLLTGYPIWQFFAIVLFAAVGDMVVVYYLPRLDPNTSAGYCSCDARIPLTKRRFICSVCGNLDMFTFYGVYLVALLALSFLGDFVRVVFG